MSDAQIDRLQVSQLEDRYNLARSAVYTRLDALGIKPEKIGNKAYINAEQIGLLDDLHQFIKAGGNTPEFLDRRGLTKPEKTSSGQSSGLSSVQPDTIQLVAAIAAEMAARLQPPATNPTPLANYEALEKAAQNGWQLRTSEIAELLDLSLDEIKQYSDRFYDAGFMFTRVGYRSQGEVAWKVSKAIK